jgi:hypothetical protein
MKATPMAPNPSAARRTTAMVRLEIIVGQAVTVVEMERNHKVLHRLASGD